MASPYVVLERLVVCPAFWLALGTITALFQVIVMWHSAAEGDRSFRSILKSGSDSLTSISTTARIHGTSSATKMVDYAICLDPDVATKRRIIKKLKSEFTPSINHTKAEYVRFKPIVISLETKRPGMDEDTAKVQLGVWAAAHLERLQELSRSTDLPMLPQILIQGHDWRLKIASLNAGSVVCIPL